MRVRRPGKERRESTEKGVHWKSKRLYTSQWSTDLGQISQSAALILKAHGAAETGMHQLAAAAAATAINSGPLRKMRVASPRSTR